MNLKREPALLFIGLLSPLAMLVTTFFTDLPAGSHVLLTAGVPALAGLITAYLVRSEGLVPAILGMGQAVIACVLAFGVPLTTDQQSGVMTLLGVIVSVVVRDRVLAPIEEMPTRTP